MSTGTLPCVGSEQKAVFAVTSFYSFGIKADAVQGHATQPFTQALHFLISWGLLGNTMLTLDLLQFIYLFYSQTPTVGSAVWDCSKGFSVEKVKPCFSTFLNSFVANSAAKH